MNLSFIIPAYNASDTIERTLDSIVCCSIPESEYEIIIVDDCSTDNTFQLCKNYSLRHTNIRILQQKENHRQGAARNRGVQEANGDYIMYVDADDIVMDGVKEAVNQALALDVDVLFCNYLWMYSDSNIEHRALPLANGTVMEGCDFTELYYDMIINTCPICYLWRRKYLLNTNIWYVEDRQIEDFDYIEKNVYYSRTVGYSNAIIYKVLTYQNLKSTTHTVSYKTVADWVHVCYRRYLFCDVIKGISPMFCEKIDGQCRAFVSSSLSFRRCSRFSVVDFKKILRRVGYAELVYLYEKGGWSVFNRLCMKHKDIASIIIAISYPIASIGRSVVSLFRKFLEK